MDQSSVPIIQRQKIAVGEACREPAEAHRSGRCVHGDHPYTADDLATADYLATADDLATADYLAK
jgi:hypothetical protein